MSIQSRKQREIREREDLVLDAADQMLQEHGYLALNLDELAKKVEYSKATLYNHFSSKEDLILGVVIRHVRLRANYFDRAYQLAAPSRERMLGCAVADRYLNRRLPHSFVLQQLISTESIWVKCSPKRQEELLALEVKCLASCRGILSDATDAGDLEPEERDSEQVMWGLIGLSKGIHLLHSEYVVQEGAPLTINPLDFLFRNYHALLDGVGWQPLSGDFNYDEAQSRIEAQLFSKESHKNT